MTISSPGSNCSFRSGRCCSFKKTLFACSAYFGSAAMFGLGHGLWCFGMWLWAAHGVSAQSRTRIGGALLFVLCLRV
jgi:hypothetical protein